MAAAWTGAIPGDSPAGQDARYEPEHEAVRDEVGKLESVTGGEVDWMAVKRDATKILTSTSKDLLMAAYLARALHVLEGFDGLSQGLALLAELAEKFWEDMQPPKKRERRRANAVTWLFDQLERELGDYEPKAQDRPKIEVLQLAFKHLTSVMGQKFENHSPATRGLRDTLTRLEMSLPAEAKPEPKPEPKAAPTPAAPAAPTAVATAPAAAVRASGASISAPAAQAAPGDAAEVVKYLRNAGTDFIKTAGLLRAADASDPLAYRLMRIGLYLHLSSPPPAESNGKTTIPAPKADLLERLDLMSANGKWGAIIDEIEGALPRARFAIELHYRCSVALAALNHGDARDAVVDGIHSLIGRMPTLLVGKFSDGSPMISPAAKAWIDSEVFPDEGGGGGGGGAGGLPEEIQSKIDKAKKSAAGGGFDEALGIMQAQVARGGSARNCFLIRLTMAETAVATAPRLALGLYAGLAHELEGLGIDSWEPALSGKCLQGLIRSQAAAAKAKPPLTTDSAFERLCRVDPAAASKI